MSNEEILSRLSQLTSSPSEIVYAITSRSILTVIVQRMGEDALALSPEDLHLAVEEVKDAISHNLDERDYIDMGLDAWEVIRNL